MTKAIYASIDDAREGKIMSSGKSAATASDTGAAVKTRPVEPLSEEIVARSRIRLKALVRERLGKASKISG